MRGKRIIPGVLLALIAATFLAACGGDENESTKESTAPKVENATVTSAIRINQKSATVTLPLFNGRTADGAPTYYIVTDSSDRADARKRGVNLAPKLANALGTKAVQRARGSGEELTFEGSVDFSPKRSVTPGKNGFPPKRFKPGAVGDDKYSPLVTTDGKTVINAPQVANDSGRHDGVVSIDSKKDEVTLSLLEGFVGGARNLYLRTEGSIPLLAAIESSTLAPNLNTAPGLGSNDPKISARSAIIPIVNGPRRADGAGQRQGLESALLDEGPPLNIEQEDPRSPAYSPLWDVHPAVWSKQAVKNGQRRRLESVDEVIKEVKVGRLTSGGESRANSSLRGLRAAKFISNCPIVSLG